MNVVLEQERQRFEARLAHLSSNSADAASDEAGEDVSTHHGGAAAHRWEVPAQKVAQALEGQEDYGCVRVLADAPNLWRFDEKKRRSGKSTFKTYTLALRRSLRGKGDVGEDSNKHSSGHRHGHIEKHQSKRDGEQDK